LEGAKHDADLVRYGYGKHSELSTANKVISFTENYFLKIVAH
jgi:hypothetical protein